MDNMQALIGGLSAQWQRERAGTQMTLGELIGALRSMPAKAHVANLGDAHSYRGYYEDLAFERGPGTRHAEKLLHDCENAMGQVFHGYKGGEYVMGANTPVWVADHGCCGEKLVSISTDIETREDD